MIPETSLGSRLAGREDAQPSESEAATSTERVFATGPIASQSSALTFLASVSRASAVVEVGTGTGESALALLRGMLPHGVLTSIDIDPDKQRSARAAFAEAGIRPARTRLISGLASQVLGRLTEGHYDLVFVHARKADYPDYLELGLGLLRSGGAIVFADVEVDDGEREQGSRQRGDGRRSGEPDHQDNTETAALRELTRRVRSDRTLVPVTLPVGSGLLAVAKT